MFTRLMPFSFRNGTILSCKSFLDLKNNSSLHEVATLITVQLIVNTIILYIAKHLRCSHASSRGMLSFLPHAVHCAKTHSAPGHNTHGFEHSANSSSAEKYNFDRRKQSFSHIPSDNSSSDRSALILEWLAGRQCDVAPLANRSADTSLAFHSIPHCMMNGRQGKHAESVST